MANEGGVGSQTVNLFAAPGSEGQGRPRAPSGLAAVRLSLAAVAAGWMAYLLSSIVRALVGSDALWMVLVGLGLSVGASWTVMAVGLGVRPTERTPVAYLWGWVTLAVMVVAGFPVIVVVGRRVARWSFALLVEEWGIPLTEAILVPFAIGAAVSLVPILVSGAVSWMVRGLGGSGAVGVVAEVRKGARLLSFPTRVLWSVVYIGAMAIIGAEITKQSPHVSVLVVPLALVGVHVVLAAMVAADGMWTAAGWYARHPWRRVVGWELLGMAISAGSAAAAAGLGAVMGESGRLGALVFLVAVVRVLGWGLGWLRGRWASDEPVAMLFPGTSIAWVLVEDIALSSFVLTFGLSAAVVMLPFLEAHAAHTEGGSMEDAWGSMPEILDITLFVCANFLVVYGLVGLGALVVERSIRWIGRRRAAVAD